MGALFGPGHLDEVWLRPFGDDVRTTLGTFDERSISTISDRMASLAGRASGNGLPVYASDPIG